MMHGSSGSVGTFPILQLVRFFFVCLFSSFFVARALIRHSFHIRLLIVLLQATLGLKVETTGAETATIFVGHPEDWAATWGPIGVPI